MTEHTDSAGGIVLNARNEIALVKNGPVFWGFPKGHIDPGEDALTAAMREITEETGLRDSRLVRDLGSYGRYKGGLNGVDDMTEFKTIYMFIFRTEDASPELAPLDEGNPEAQWFPIDKVEAVLSNERDREFFRNNLALIKDVIDG